VEFEAPAESLARLRGAGVAVAKLQLSSALAVARMDSAAAGALRRFDDGVYLHQVVERGQDGHLVRFLDLPDALAAWYGGDNDGAAAGAREWRVHCHVPVFHDALDSFGTTQPVLLDMLARQREEGVSAHLEVETYTWDVLPPELRAGGIDAAIAREIGWVRERLAA
jgi:ABC-type amino acid transport substrate-binding protein